MIAPRVHMNGTSKQDLTMNQIYPAVVAITAAIEALTQTAPHARDYYVYNDPMAYPQARREFVRRMKALEAVKDELMEMFRSIEEGDARFALPPCKECCAEVVIHACNCD